jgi:hypothetical protein
MGLLISLTSSGQYIGREQSSIWLVIGAVLFLGNALAMLSSRHRNKDFWSGEGDAEWSIRRGMDRARTVIGVALGTWGLAFVVDRLCLWSRGELLSAVLGLLALAGLVLLLVAGAVIVFNRPKFAAPRKYRADESPFRRYFREGGES